MKKVTSKTYFSVNGQVPVQAATSAWRTPTRSPTRCCRIGLAGKVIVGRSQAITVR